jgi:hypothetical protein
MLIADPFVVRQTQCDRGTVALLRSIPALAIVVRNDFVTLMP